MMLYYLKRLSVVQKISANEKVFNRKIKKCERRDEKEFYFYSKGDSTFSRKTEMGIHYKDRLDIVLPYFSKSYKKYKFSDGIEKQTLGIGYLFDSPSLEMTKYLYYDIEVSDRNRKHIK